MKKVLIALTLMATILIAGFTSSQHTMFIKPSKFSEQTKKVLTLLGDVQFYDITLDDAVKSYVMSVWVYHNGEWVENGGTSGEIEFLSSKIAIKLTDRSCDLYYFDEDGHGIYRFYLSETDFENCTAIGNAKIAELTTIELNKETPIWVKIGTDKNSIRTIDITQDFRTYDCNAGVVVTLTASDEILE